MAHATKRKRSHRHSITEAPQRKSTRLWNRPYFDNDNVKNNGHCDFSETPEEIVVCLPCPQMPEPHEKKTKPRKNKTVINKKSISESESDKENIEPENKKRSGGTKKSMPLLWGSSCEGWSKEQDIALHNAYYTVKALPNFWKKVAKLVPGKSSNECFNRFYSAFPTPPVSQSRSRINGKTFESPIRSFENDINTLLKSDGSTGIRTGSSKQKILNAHKTVRQILRRHKNADKEYETDLFSAVETLDSSLPYFPIPITSAPITPDCCQKSGGESVFDQTLTAHWHKSLSRFSSVSNNELVSPEVLKQVKNPALHDKYIDMLHSRDVARKASSKNTKVQSNYVQTGVVGLPQTEVVCAAKAAVVAEAQQVLRQSQTNGEKDTLSIGYCTSEDCEEDENSEEEILEVDLK